MIFDYECIHATPVQVVKVEFSLPKAGWVRCRVIPLHDKFAISCTYIWSPFGKLLTWLEQIADGSDACTWLVDQEGSCSRLQFLGGSASVDDRTDYLLHVQSAESLHRIRGMAVQRRQLVDGFYRGFRAMADSPDYSPREWDAHPEFHRLNDMEDHEYTAAMRAFPYGGEPLRPLRSPRVEAWLADEGTEDPQLSLFPDGFHRR